MVGQEQQQQEGTLAVYNVNVQGRQTKAGDLWSFRDWILLKEKSMSVLMINVGRLPENTSISFIQAQAFQEAWFELKGMIDESLGIVEQKVIEDEPEVQPEVVAPKQKVQQRDRPPVVRTQEKSAGPNVEFFEDPKGEAGDDDMVTL